MAPILEWKKIMRVDPDALPRQEDLADSLLETVAKVDGNALKDETSSHLIQLFKISQSLMKMKNQEVELALEEVEKAGEEQAKFENQLKTKVMKLEKELEIAQRSTGSRDTRFLRDEIRQLEKQLSQKDRELADMEKDLDKEKKVNEQLTLRNEETENENSKLRRENEQLHQDVIDYQRQLETQKETLLSRRGEDSDYRSQLSKKNFELVQYLDEIQNLTEANEKLEGQNKEMRKNLEESVQEMENMTDEYNKMKFMVQQSDIAMDQLRKEKEQYRLQVHELTDQLKAKNEEDDPLMIAVNEKVEEWKRILASKDDEIIEYQEMLLTLKEKLKMAQLDSDKSNVLALQQGVQERDSQIKLLTEQIEQYTKEMEKNVLIIEDMKRELQKDKSRLSISQQDLFGEMQGKLQMLEEKVKDSERTAELAEADAREKDKELIETLKRVKDYETGIYGLEDAVAEIKGLKKQLKIRNSEIETLIKEVNKLAFKINDLLDENEDLREQLGLDPKTMIDLTELKNSKALKQQQYKAENQVLLKEIETLEEERVTLKQQIRKLAQEKGRKAAILGLDTDDLQLIDNFTEDLKMKRERSELMSTSNFDKLKTKEMATFKIAALQKALDDSVPLNDLEMANKQYNDLTAKYRDMLQKDNLLIQRTNNMEHLEHENTSLKNQIESLNKELEITKEKLHTIEQAWEQTVKLGDNTTDKATKAITNSEIVSISKKITMLEMKELNERQRAEHCQRMYEHLRNTLKQAEERNIELEAKFAELTKINFEAQKVEQSLRDELSNSVSKGISEVDKRRIMELEKSETELKIEISKLKELSDIAKTQVTALENRQQSRDKEVESLRMQILDYQVQSDEKTLIAKLHQHIVALQVSEATAITKLAAATSKLQNTEITNMRLEQKLDDKEQALYYARLEGKNRVKHLRQTIQSLRRQFSGALPLAQQEKFSKTMIQLQNDKLKTMEDIQQAQQERRNAENRAVELEMKLKGIEELVATLKDARGAQKVIEWHVKIEELRLQELKLNRELSRKNEEIKYLKNILSEYEETINHLEEEIVQQGQFHEERQMAWDKREVELERQLDIYDSQKQDILSTAQKFNEAAGTVPDPTLSLPHQLEQALKTVREQSRTILEMQATCKSVEEKLKEKEATLWKAEQNILLRDKVINELRLQLPASSEREKLVAQLDQIDDNTNPHALKIAHQTIANMQARLNQKEEILKKYQHLLAKAREEQEEIAKKHEEDLRVLHQKLDVHVDSSFNKFKQTALELIQKPSLAVPASKHLIRVAELEQTIAEQDSSLNSLLSKLKKTSTDLQKQKQITAVKINEFDNIRAQLEEKHQCRVKKLQDEIEDLRSLLSKMGKELLNIKSELEIQRQANNRSPTTTMKNLVERLKNQLALKEKQQKALSKALLELRAEMTAAAEQQIISVASQKEAHMNVQQIVDKHTKELRSQIEDLNDQLLKLKDALKLSKNKENSLLDDMDDLNQELQKKTKAYTKVLREKDDMEKDNEELKNQNKRLTSSIQGKADEQILIDELQRKIKRMETELGKKSDESEKKNPREDRMLKSPREELIKWEECKKWQTKADGMRNKLKEKEKEIESLSKQLNTMKELFSKAEKEKNTLQKKLKSCSVTVDHVMGVRASESERELEELRKQNMDLENEVVHLKTQYAVPRDAVVEDLHLKNRYLQEKLLVLEKQLPRDTCSRPSTSGIGSDDQHQKEQELQKENLILSSENMELRFQLEQANKDLPRLKNQVADLKEMCELLKREKGEAERKLGNVRGAGRSGKTIPELEKTIGLMKKVVERVQRENEELKRAPGVVANEKVARLEQENEDLRSEMEKLKLHFGSELSARYELKTKGTEKIIAENDRIRKELKKEVENAEKLRMAKNNLEIINEKLNVELEETTKKLNFAESRIPKLEDADTKNWKSIVITRMFENKLKEMESEIARKNQIIRDLKQKLQKPTESADKNENCIEDYLTEQADVLKSVPGGTKTEQEYVRENQLLRLPNDHLEKENGELIYLMESSQNQRKLKGDDLAAEKTVNYKLVAEVTGLKTQLKSSDLEQQRLHEEIRKLKNELDHFDPAFFEEIEDLKYNYNEEVKKNIVLEEKLKTLSEKFGVQIDIPGRISID
ncbi:PREDICTED: centrosomal protein of 290 kDa [Thamnophis sirtalis]|uniref:Centrosomal protein of 290 kDa n=1 Tax=Thamnophis sirtalis TaxID=35019 RepID=A0A6I9Z5N9_9SAUR|nr:PREDICTED: centrosomal protein of 290 kDa [Thamnophis sirtalis]